MNALFYELENISSLKKDLTLKKTTNNTHTNKVLQGDFLHNIKTTVPFNIVVWSCLCVCVCSHNWKRFWFPRTRTTLQCVTPTASWNFKLFSAKTFSIYCFCNLGGMLHRGKLSTGRAAHLQYIWPQEQHFNQEITWLRDYRVLPHNSMAMEASWQSRNDPVE